MVVFDMIEFSENIEIIYEIIDVYSIIVSAG